MKTEVISRNLSDKSVSHALRITDDQGHWIEFDCVDFVNAREMEISVGTLVEAHTVEQLDRQFCVAKA